MTVDTPVATASRARADRRRFFVAGSIGALLAAIVFVAILLDGHLNPLRVVPPTPSFGGSLGSFYDAQAHSLLHLHWSLPARVLGVEGFKMSDGTFIYFGPWPAILRLPIAAVTDRFDGRLTQMSMLLAYAVALTFTLRLAWRIRSLVLPEVAVGRAEAFVTAAFVFTVGAGSVLLHLGAERVVFHEALIWGVAWALGALELVLAFTASLRPRYLVLASLLTLLALFSRAALGAGPLAALGVLLLVAVVGRGRGVFGLADGRDLRRLALPLAVAVLVPAGLYVAVNLVKFGTPLSLPFERQMITLFNPTHRAVLLRNGGTLVGLRFVPTNLLQYFRPDALRFTGDFPFVTFPGPATMIGSVRPDQVMPTASVPATMPLLTVLGLVGVAGIVAAAPRRHRALAALRAPLLGTVGAGVVTLAFGFISNRYLADFVPLLVMTGLAGLFLLYAWSRAHPGALVRAAWVGVAVLAVASVWFSTGLAIRWQDADPPAILTGRSFPAPGSLGTVFIRGDCAGLFRSSGSEWRALELTPSTGRYRLRVTFPTGRSSGREPLVTSGARGSGQYVFVEYRPGNRAVLGVRLERRRVEKLGRPFPIRPGTAVPISIDIDPLVPRVAAAMNGSPTLELLGGTQGYVAPVHHATVGRNTLGGPVATRFTGRIESLPVHTPDCRRFQRQAARVR